MRFEIRSDAGAASPFFITGCGNQPCRITSQQRQDTRRLIALATPDKAFGGHLEPGTEIFTVGIMTNRYHEDGAPILLTSTISPTGERPTVKAVRGYKAKA
jgi:hypothetical protein